MALSGHTSLSLMGFLLLWYQCIVMEGPLAAFNSTKDKSIVFSFLNFFDTNTVFHGEF